MKLAIHTPHPVDVHVGRRLRLRRQLMGLTQQEFAAKIGVTFQQVQKYESGANRLSASRLHAACTALNIPHAFLFDDLPEALATVPVTDSDLSTDELSVALALRRMRPDQRDGVRAVIAAIVKPGLAPMAAE